MTGFQPGGQNGRVDRAVGLLSEALGQPRCCHFQAAWPWINHFIHLFIFHEWLGMECVAQHKYWQKSEGLAWRAHSAHTNVGTLVRQHWEGTTAAKTCVNSPGNPFLGSCLRKRVRGSWFLFLFFNGSEGKSKAEPQNLSLLCGLSAAPTRLGCYWLSLIVLGWLFLSMLSGVTDKNAGCSWSLWRHPAVSLCSSFLTVT